MIKASINVSNKDHMSSIWNNNVPFGNLRRSGNVGNGLSDSSIIVPKTISMHVAAEEGSKWGEKKLKIQGQNRP